MIYPALTGSAEELRQIIQLQKENHFGNLGEDEKRSQGFLTLRHDLATLQQMHDLAPSVIIKDDDKVVAYALTMLQECRRLIPDLDHMFALFDRLSWKNRPLTDYHFYVMGQVCVAKPYRGKGLFEQLYLYHKEVYRSRFHLFMTEISSSNHRSLRAHEKAGFKTIHTYRTESDEWQVVAWDWS